MSWQDLWLRLRALITRTRVERELDEELQFHIAMQTRKNLAAGMPPEEARRRARVTFGGSDQIKEECRDVRGVRWIEEFFQDIRYAARNLRRSPMFASVAILSLALGIGANTAIFSLIDTVMLRMMPVQEPERLVQFTKFYDGQLGTISYPLFERLRDQSRSFAGMFARASFGRSEVNFGREPELVETELVSGSYYSILGVKAILGRVFGDEEDRTLGANPIAVISYRFWKRRFASDPAAVGKTFRLNGTVFTIIGVTPPEFFGVVVGHTPDITFPLAMDGQVRPGDLGPGSWRDNQGTNWLSLMTRLKPGVHFQQAKAEVRVLFDQSIHEQVAQSNDPRSKKAALDQRMELDSAGNGFAGLRREYSQPLLILMSVVGLVLCIACSNLANLLLARATTRRREISIRMSIGASRGRMIRQLLTESLLLSALGGAVSIALAVWFSNLMIRLMANGGAPLAIEIRPDLRVIGFTAAVGMVTCLFFGLAPALQATQINLSPGLKETAAGARRRLSKGLVVVQIALALMLTAGAGLFVRTLINFYALDAGFRSNGVLLFGVNASKAGYKDERFRALQAQILDRLNSLSGVRSASVSLVLPISGGGSAWTGSVLVEGYTHRPDEDNELHFNEVGPKFFQTAGTPVLIGREFSERDVPGAAGVAIVNETFARYYFAGRSPVGKHLTMGNRQFEIVGVATDMKYRTLRQAFPRTVYFAALQNASPAGWGTYLVRTAGAPVGFTHSVEQAIREINPALRVSDVVTLAEHVDRSIFKERIMAALATIFGLLAIAVACLGVYGTMAFQVVRRTNEIGIRIALGAQRGDLIWMILREITILLAFGITGGLLGALATTRLTEALLFQVKPTDPSTFALAAAICCVVVLAAGYLPARRASLVDPIEALRCE